MASGVIGRPRRGDYLRFPNTLAELRADAKHGRRQYEYAHRLGLDARRYAILEGGRELPTAEEAMTIAFALGMSVDEVFPLLNPVVRLLRGRRGSGA